MQGPVTPTNSGGGCLVVALVVLAPIVAALAAVRGWS